MHATEVRTIFHSVLSQHMQNLGFMRLTGPPANWYRKVDEGLYLLVCLHLTQTGFSTAFGNTFSLEFTYAVAPGKRHIFGHTYTENAFLDHEQAARIKAMRAAAIAVIPRPGSDSVLGLNCYYNADHVRQYAAFLAEVMPQMLQRIPAAPQ